MELYKYDGNNSDVLISILGDRFFKDGEKGVFVVFGTSNVRVIAVGDYVGVSDDNSSPFIITSGMLQNLKVI